MFYHDWMMCLLHFHNLKHWNVSQISFASNIVHEANSGEAQKSNIEKEKEEWLVSQIANAIICPRAMVIHHVHTSLTFATMMYGFYFHCSTLQALLTINQMICIHIFSIKPLCFLLSFISCIFPFVLVFGIIKHLIVSEVFPFNKAWIIAVLC